MSVFGFKRNKCKEEVYTTEEVDTKLYNVGLTGQCKQISGDLDTNCGNNTGFYRGINLKNRPTNASEWVYVVQLVHDENYKKQLLFNVSDNAAWVRTQTEGSWNNWAKFTTTTN